MVIMILVYEGKIEYEIILMEIFLEFFVYGKDIMIRYLVIY